LPLCVFAAAGTYPTFFLYRTCRHNIPKTNWRTKELPLKSTSCFDSNQRRNSSFHAGEVKNLRHFFMCFLRFVFLLFFLKTLSIHILLFHLLFPQYIGISLPCLCRAVFSSRNYQTRMVFRVLFDVLMHHPLDSFCFFRTGILTAPGISLELMCDDGK
jgi:hypothetical protein